MRVRDVVVAARCSLAWGRSVRAGSSVAGSVMFAGPHARIRYGFVTVFVCAGASGQVSGVPGWLVRLIPRRAAVRDRNAYIGVLLRRPRHPDVT